MHTLHPSIENLQSILEKLASRLRPVSTETLPWQLAHGRFLACDLAMDRDSPASDVSAMDGYAMRLDDVGRSLVVAGTINAGSPAIPIPAGACVRIFTGAPVPEQAECVVRREDTIEGPTSIDFREATLRPRLGENIRRRGENAKSGSKILESGSLLGATAIAGASHVGAATIEVHRKLRVAILNTGDEIRDVGDPVEDWQIRDSNGPFLESLVRGESYTELLHRKRIGDDRSSIAHALKDAFANADVVLLTGGVSMGDTDHVPDAVRDTGAEVVLHKIPIRPGRPLLGAVGPQAQLVLGLPGNPVSVAVTAVRFGLPLMRTMAGASQPWEKTASVTIANPDDRRLHLVWYRLAKLSSPGTVILNENKGSGDVVALAGSDGFVEIPIDQSGAGPWNWYPWHS